MHTVHTDPGGMLFRLNIMGLRRTHDDESARSALLCDALEYAVVCSKCALGTLPPADGGLMSSLGLIYDVLIDFALFCMWLLLTFLW